MTEELEGGLRSGCAARSFGDKTWSLGALDLMVFALLRQGCTAQSVPIFRDWIT